MADNRFSVTPTPYPQTSVTSYPSDSSTRSANEPVGPKPQFIASNESGTGYITYTADAVPEFLLPKEEPPSLWERTFAACTKPSWFEGWSNAFGMFKDWVTGSGDVDRTFTQCTRQVQDLADAHGVNLARDAFYEKNAGKPYEEWESLTNYRGAFGLSGLVRAGIDPTEQYVGSYRVDIVPQESSLLRFEVTNNTSMTSFLYGLGPSYERSDFDYGGNMRQTYTWEEPLRDSEY